MARSKKIRDAAVQNALAIAVEYQQWDLTLTLRQMYYQFVSRGLIQSGQKYYKSLGKFLTEARYSGDYPVDWLEDRSRTVAPGDYLRNDIDVEEALEYGAKTVQQMPEIALNMARWYGQNTHVSVWVEKEALAGVFQPVCDALGVSWFACKGYPSVSSLNEWLHGLGSATKCSQSRATVLYFGDHDPDGWEIPRSAERNIKKLQDVNGTSIPIRFERVALNMDQIEAHNPPPFDAKVTSSRYEKYVREHDTDNAWELDALDPLTLRALIREQVTALFDSATHENNRVLIAEKRIRMRELMQGAGWLSEALDLDDDDFHGYVHDMNDAREYDEYPREGE